jgi:tRNA-intron endonuclease
MPGQLLDGEVILEDPVEANQIYGKGYYGVPLSGGGLSLDLLEALYLVESGRLEVRRKGRAVSLPTLIRAAHRILPRFEIAYLVFRDLRQRGYVVKADAGPPDFRVLPRGGAPGKTPSKYWALALSERSVFSLRRLITLLQKVSALRKTLLLGLVDEESDLTYYVASLVDLRGSGKSRRRAKVADAMLMEDRSLVLDPREAQALHELEFFGKMVGGSLQLSLLETAHLADRKLIEVRDVRTGRVVSPRRAMERAKAVQPDFPLRFAVYQDLKDRGMIVKTGFKYGSHFRVYAGDPENQHAKYLVHSLPESHEGMWPEVSRAVRVAHGVRKDLVFGEVGRKVQYVKFRRVRP